MQTKSIQLTALAAAFVCGAALAETTPPASAPGAASTTPVMTGADYTRMDKDKDGALSKKEAVSNKELSTQWSTLDVNQDGKLDEAEFAQFESGPLSNDNGMDNDGLRKDNKPKY